MIFEAVDHIDRKKQTCPELPCDNWDKQSWNYHLLQEPDMYVRQFKREENVRLSVATIRVNLSVGKSRG